MKTIDTNEIIGQAKKMRAEEIRRIEGLAAKRLGLYFRLLAGSAADAGNSLQPLFSWNPQDAKSPRRSGPSLLSRASMALRSLFSWNPQAHHS